MGRSSVPFLVAPCIGTGLFWLFLLQQTPAHWGLYHVQHTKAHTSAEHRTQLCLELPGLLYNSRGVNTALSPLQPAQIGGWWCDYCEGNASKCLSNHHVVGTHRNAEFMPFRGKMCVLCIMPGGWFMVLIFDKWSTVISNYLPGMCVKASISFPYVSEECFCTWVTTE